VIIGCRPGLDGLASLVDALAAWELVNQAYENKELRTTRTLGPILDGLMQKNAPRAPTFDRARRCRRHSRTALTETPRSATTATTARGARLRVTRL
jgi:hypothetical protein